MENLQMGAAMADPGHFDADIERVLLCFAPQERMHQRGGTLSGGEQQIAGDRPRLDGRPRLLLLDEPRSLAPLIARPDFSLRSRRSTTTRAPVSWWSRMPSTPCGWRIVAMSWSTA